MASEKSLHVHLCHDGGAAAPWLDLNLGPGPEEALDAIPCASASCDEVPEGSSAYSSFSKSGSPEPRNLRRREALPVSPARAGGTHLQSPYVGCPSRRRQRDPRKGDYDTSRDAEVLSLRSRKRRRAAAVSRISENRRRGRFNQKIKILQKIVPNSPKGDKLSILDRAIDHLKQLQAQQRMLEYLRLTSHAMALPQHLFVPAMPTIVPRPETRLVSINIQAPPIIFHLPYFYL